MPQKTFCVWDLHDAYGEVQVVNDSRAFPPGAMSLIDDPNRPPRHDHKVVLDVPVLMYGDRDEVNADIREMVLSQLEPIK